MKYKVGDRVRIKSIDWYNKYKDKNGVVLLTTQLFTPGMSQFCGKVMTIENVEDINNNVAYYMEEIDYDWTDEMIDCLVERNGKTYPYKIGDRVVLKGNNRCATITDLKYNSFGNLSYYIKIENDRHSIDYPTDLLLPYKEPKFKVGDILFYRGETSGYLKVEEIREENGEIRYYETSRNVYLVENDPDVFADKVCSVETEETKSEDELLDEYEELTDRAFKGGYEKCKSDIELNGFKLPDGYIFKDDNGNVINAQKIVLEKKTVEEKYSDVKIQIFGNVVILKGGINADNPTEYMNEVVDYVLKLLGNPKHNQFIEEFLDNPWVRILVFDFNSMEFNNSFDDIVTNFKQ